MANSAQPSAMHEASRSIIERETSASEDPARVAEGVERALRQVQELFSNVIGQRGFEGVLTRAVHLARASCRWLEQTDVIVNPTVKLTELASIAQREGPEQVKAGATLILETFLALLATFMGEELTLSLLRGRWASLPGPGPGSQEDGDHDPE